MSLNNKSSLNSKQKRYLNGLAHNLKPVVMLGDAGLSEGVISETVSRLEHHELIKVRISGMDRTERTKTAETLAQKTDSALVNTIGHVAILYKAGKKPQIKLPG